MLKEKKILVLSTGDNHGAYEVAYKISKFLYDSEYIVALAVLQKTKTDSFIIQIPPKPKSLIERFYSKCIFLFSRTFKIRIKSEPFFTDEKYYFLTKDENEEYVSGHRILSKLSFVPDLIIAGMTDGFCTTNTLSELKEKTNARIYSWLVDMAPLTGGCHYAWDCKGYETDCTNCPAILESSKKDRAHRNLMIKRINVLKSDIRVLSGSQWVTNQAKKSLLYKSQKNYFNTHACIDTRILNGNNRNIAKNVFNLPLDAKVIFTGSWSINDARKGLTYFLESLNFLWSSMDSALKEKVYVLVVGEHYGKTDFLEAIPFKKLYIDYIKDYRLLSLVYQASDLFVCASVEDSGPMMVSEALACGTPVVGFEMGNVFSLIENGVNGYVAELRNSKDLANGIDKILSLDDIAFSKYSENCIKIAEQTSSHHAAVKVIESLFYDD